MKLEKIIFSIGLILFGLVGVNAQETVSATGKEATGTGGTSNYTIGQIVYTVETGTNGSVSQGVQQPYEISTTMGLNEATINLELSVYPNPTINTLTLKVVDNGDLSYRIYNLNGKLIETKLVQNTSTTINLEGMSSTTYLLKIIKNNQVIKTFKVVKK